MGNTFFPTKKGIDNSPQVGQPPASIRRGGADPVSPGSNEVADRTSAIVHAFVSAQRQAYSTSIVDYHAQNLDHPDVSVRYINNNGAETITVSPKPRANPSNPQEVAEEVAYEHAHPEEFKEEQDHPTKYLMVLFTCADPANPDTPPFKNGIAAFDMAALTPKGCGAAVYLDQSQGSKWVDDFGKILQVGQYQFGTHGYILCPIDFTPPDAQGNKHSARGLFLSTTDLTDGQGTDADITAIPIMNAAGDGVLYTIGGKYQSQSGGLIKQQGMTTDPFNGVTVSPHAIEPTGVSYFFNTVHSDVTAYVDYSFVGPYTQSNKFNTDLFLAEQLLLDSIPDPLVFATYLSESLENDFGSGHIETINKKTITVYTVGPYVATAHRIGESYYGKGNFGQPPAPFNVKVAEADSDAEVFDIDLNHTVIKPIPLIHSDPNFSNDWPLMSYDFGTAVPGVTMFHLNATAIGAEPLIAYTDKFSFGSAAQPVEFFYTATMGADRLVETSTSELPGVTYADSHAYGTDFATVTALYDSIKVMNLLATGLIDHREYTATPLVGESFSDPSANFATGDYSFPADAPYPAGTASIEITSGPFDVHAATDQHDPYIVGAHSGDRTRRTDFSLFDISITINQTWPYAGGGHQALALPKVNVHAFPLALGIHGQTLPFYTLDEGRDNDSSPPEAIRTHTPYGVFLAGRIDAFTPWLHVSNSKHCIQGFYVGTSPYAFVDGSTNTGFLTAIAKACKCKDSEIVAMFMDIELRTIKDVANVKLPDYSLSANFPPPVPGH